MVSSVYINFESAFNEEESLEKGSASERFDEVGENYIHELLKERKKLIILMDKSSGTNHTEAKQKLISQMQIHIEVSLKRQSEKEYDPMLAHILASNFTEGLLEIARHYLCSGKIFAPNCPTKDGATIATTCFALQMVRTS